MDSVPLLQLALDYTDLPTAMAMAYRVAPEVDIIEVGTPLIKAIGMPGVRAIHELCPNNTLLADMKTPDVGSLEAQLAFEADADWMTVIGGATLATVKAALDEADKRGKEILMEMTGVRDILSAAQEWKHLGVTRVVYHREWDAQAAGRQWNDQDLLLIRQLIEIDFKVTVTGGITADLIPFFQGLPVSVFVAGRSIYTDLDPVDAARRLHGLIHHFWDD